MFMKKRRAFTIVQIFLLFVCCLVCALFSACDLLPGDSSCTHASVIETEKNRVKASCDKEGGYDIYFSCADCGAALGIEHRAIEALGHDIVHHDGKEASCTESGYAAYDTCTRCNYTTYKEIPETGHTWGEPFVEEGGVEPTCIHGGWYFEVVNCTKCGEQFSREYYEFEALGHDMKTIPGKTATCGDVGWETYEVCTCCGDSTYVEIPSKNHANVTTTTTYTDSTCTKAGGCDIVVTCNDCGKITYEEHTPYDLAQHVRATEIKENEKIADCYNAGGYDLVVHCTNPECSYEFSRRHFDVPITHVPSAAVRENVVEPTYGYQNTGTDGSYDEVTYCSLCKEKISTTPKVLKITAEEYYSQYDYLEFSATSNKPENLTDNGDGTYTMTAKTNSGTRVRLLIEGEIGELDGGWGSFDENTKVYLLDALPGINYIEYNVDTTSKKNFLFGGYVSLKGDASVQTFDGLLNFSSVEVSRGVTALGTELRLYPNFLSFNELGASADVVYMRFYFCDEMSKLKDIKMNETMYTNSFTASYVPGDWYDGRLEKSGDEFGFPLLILVDNPKALAGENIYYRDVGNFADVEFGDIIDVNGNRFDRMSRYVQAGDQIEVTIGSCTKLLELCTKTFDGDSLYETSPAMYIQSTGTQNVLVVPVTFLDQEERIDEEWMSVLKGILGNVIEEGGEVKKYSLTNGNTSLSKFMSTSSYGKFTTNSLITEPYVIQGNGSDYYDVSFSQKLAGEISDWLKTLTLDRAAFDQDNDGYYDVVLFVNTLLLGDGGYEGYKQAGMSGAYEGAFYTDYEKAGTHESPTVNTFINISGLKLCSTEKEVTEENAETYTFIHEFGHVLGLQDYYANGEQINTLGYFDMEADNKGDWNSYTKYLLGWIEPTIVDGKEDEVKITIQSYSTHGDAIVIHALDYDAKGTPFDEYIIIDLFAHDGLYAKDASAFGLENAVGVRVYHVNSVYDVCGEDGGYILPHHRVSSYSTYASQGKYLIEMVQKGNVNTFMNYVENPSYETTQGYRVDADDLFYAGDTFSVDAYDNFFHNGKMDNGMDFGYAIKIEEIVEKGADSTATIVISKKKA